MINERAAEHWDLELDDLFLTIGHRFRRVERYLAAQADKGTGPSVRQYPTGLIRHDPTPVTDWPHSPY
ncbi:hypothetical protein [Streptomyces sp. NPDC001978]|uniref:hypothetical protein n=1 Tax=Streptomyces sp. NPDC001978 TaxID=3364627 RepID=UPI00367FC0C3